MRLLCIISLLFCFSTQCYSQFYKRSQRDSLEKRLVNQEGKEHINTLLNLSIAYTNFQIDTATQYANIASEESKKIGYSWGVYKSQFCHAKIKYQNSKVDDVKSILEKCGIWFKTNGYRKDYLSCALLYTNCVNQLHGKLASKWMADKVLKEAQIEKDARLIGWAWLNVYFSEEPWRKNTANFSTIDSALYYMEIAKDSMMLNNTKYVKLGMGSIFNLRNTGPFVQECLAQSRRWQNQKAICKFLINSSIVFAVNRQLDSCKVYFKKTHDIAQSYGGLRDVKTALKVFGHANTFMGDLSDGISYFKQSLVLSQKYKYRSDEAELNLQLGVAYGNIGEYEVSIGYVLEALRIAEILQDVLFKIRANQMLANYHFLTGEMEKAEAVYLEALDWVKKYVSEDFNWLHFAPIYRQLADLEIHKSNYEEARNYYELAIMHSKDNKIRSAAIYQNQILLTYLKENNLKDASIEYEKMLGTYSEATLESIPPFHLVKGSLLIEKGEYEKANKALTLFIQKSNKGGNLNHLKSAYLKKAKANENLGDFEAAFGAFKMYNEISDSLNNKKELQKVQKVQSDYDISLKEVEIENLQQQKELSDLKIVQKDNELSLRNSYLSLLISAFLLLSIIGYLLFRRLRFKKEEENRTLEISNLKSLQKAELAEVKNVLYANISHELKTPLTLIRVPIQNYKEKAPIADRPIFDSVVRNTDYLLEMIDEILDVSNMHSGKFTLQKSAFDLNEFLQRIKLNFIPLFQEKNIQFNWEIAINSNIFSGDEDRLNIVINNLLKNAYNHAPENGQVKCTVSLEEQLEITVSNTGKPITAEDLPRIFDRHYRGIENNHAGNGIGLAWSKQIVELHKGTIHVDNTMHNEVTFIVCLPKLTENIPTKKRNFVDKIPNMQKERTALKKGKNTLSIPENLPHVLVVEDNMEMQHLLKTSLKHDYRLDFAENGVIGEEKTIQLQPNLVLSDVMMPKKDGFELLKTLKENFNSSHIPIILLTARADSKSRIAGLNQDADDYIGKPFETNELKARINNLLRQRQHLHKLFSENPLIYSKEISCTPLDADFIDKARKILESNFSDGDFTVNQFCLELALNRTSVNNKLKALSNQTTAEYIKNFRLEKAVKMLVETNSNISHIYMDTGFNNPQVFNKVFKQKFGSTPSVYRAEFRK